jgi:tetratricopeptide (TPR) repeat protein
MASKLTCRSGIAFACGFCLLLTLHAQETAPPDPLTQHYKAAEEFVREGQQERAVPEYRAFLAEALHRLALARSAAGDFAAAAPLFEQALGLAPEDKSLYMDFSRACFGAAMYPRAQELAEHAVRLDPKDTQAHLLLGQVLYQLGDYKASRPELELVFAKTPEANEGYLLGTNYLLLGDSKAARELFDQMLRKWGNTAFNHSLIGRAYSQTGHPEEAFAEFHKAIAIDPQALQTHYQLGLAYLLRNEATGFEKAIPEFLAELKLNPKDFASHYTLGYIAVKQRRWADAEQELLKAIALNPGDRQTLLELAETCVATNRPSAAEANLRKAIEIGKDLPPDHWTERAHYMLGHVLLSQGRTEEAKKELDVVASIQKELGPASARVPEAGAQGAEAPTAPEGLLSAPGSGASGANAERQQRLQEFFQRISPAISNAYNNLGVAAGNQNDFAGALMYLREAREWDPAHAGLDRNLGMAAFYAKQYREAVDPLRQHLQEQPDDAAARAALGFSLFDIEDFQGAAEALRPLQDQMAPTPKLAYVYAASLARSGKYDEGIDRLKSLEAANPNAPDVHHELALAYQREGHQQDAVREMKIYQDLQAQIPANPPSK